MGAKADRSLRISPAADEDLYTIWRDGVIKWSESRADAYLHGLHMALERLCDHPAIASERTEFNPPVRVYTYRSHVIVYRETDEFLDIVRIRHGREDWTRDLAG